MLKSFFDEVRIEMQKVNWPTREQTSGATIAVIIFSLIVASFVGLLDFIISRLLGFLMR